MNDMPQEDWLPPVSIDNHDAIQQALNEAVATANECHEGEPAEYVRDFYETPLDETGASVTLIDGECFMAGDAAHRPVTLQSVGKLVLLTGLLEDLGHDVVFDRVGKEPSGDSFRSLARLEHNRGRAANPLINAGAIALCSMIPGTVADRIEWIHTWAQRLFAQELAFDEDIRLSERVTGDHNRAMAYFLRYLGMLDGSADDALEAYFYLCSLTADVCEAAQLPALLARGGFDVDGGDVLSPSTVKAVVSLMATCGTYDESGSHLLLTGLPAKSGVSGLTVAVALRRAGLAAYSPRLSPKGGSVRGAIILRELSHSLGWHFADPRHTRSGAER